MVPNLMSGSGSAILHRLARLAGAACLCVILAACNGANANVEKAQIAVRANPALELVATDERQGVVTVRVKSSGQTLAVTVTDILNGTAFRNLDTASAPGQPDSRGSVAASPGPAGTPRVDISGAGGQPSATSSGSGVTIGSSSGGGVRTSTQSGKPSVEVGGKGRQLSVGGSNGGVAIGSSAAGKPSPQVEAAAPGADVSAGRAPNGGPSNGTPESQVRIGGNGSGVDVQSDSRAREPRSPASGSATQADAAGRGAVIDESRLVRRTRPISCIGSHSEDLTDVLMRIDEVAISTIGSCKIRIKNSHIIGHTALQITGSTTVSIENSIIEGQVALLLQGSTNVSVRSSTILGAVQKVGAAKLNDLGGNVWR